jgi:uncharacterized membrane protein YdjX (TVP38/TMEM64 family)
VATWHLETRQDLLSDQHLLVRRDKEFSVSLVPALLAISATRYAFGSVIYFILWVAVMVWVYNIAKRKGRHAVGWVILAFFFFFLALILILLLPSKRTTERTSRS